MPITGIRTRFLAGAAALVLLGAIAGCSSGSGATTAPATAAPAASAPGAASASAPAAVPGGVTIQDFAFSPTSTTVSVGATVIWTNKDTTGHTVTADDGSFDSKTIASGSTFSQTFSKAGTYAYHCSIHSSMKATIVVQ